jgi:hypothetical protein
VRSTGSDWSEEENSNNGAPYNNRTFSFMAVRDSPAPPHLHPDMNMYWDNVRQEAVCSDTLQSDDISELTMMTDEDATVQLAQWRRKREERRRAMRDREVERLRIERRGVTERLRIERLRDREVER